MLFRETTPPCIVPVFLQGKSGAHSLGGSRVIRSDFLQDFLGSLAIDLIPKPRRQTFALPGGNFPRFSRDVIWNG